MANANTKPVGRVQVLPTFEAEVRQARAISQARANQLLQKDTAPGEIQCLTTPTDIHSWYAAADKEISEAVDVALGASDGVIGTIGSLQGAAMQGDFMHVRRRATALRQASAARRAVHTAARRLAYSRVESGYLDNRIVGGVIAALKESME